MSAFACSEKYMKFSLEGGKCVILDTEQAKRESPLILSLHAIPSDRSKELRCVFLASVLRLHEGHLLMRRVGRASVLAVLPWM